MTSGKILLGALAGVALGATLGVLFAPDKGSATRRKISKRGTDYASDLSDKFNSFIESATHKFETMMDEATHVAENGKAKVQKVEADLAATSTPRTR